MSLSLTRLRTLAPGLGTAASIFALASLAPLPTAPLCVAGGMAARALAPRRAVPTLEPGASLCAKPVLQAGIVCVGLKLSAFDALALGASGLPVAGAFAGATLASGLLVARLLNVSPTLGAVVASGERLAAERVCGCARTFGNRNRKSY